MSHMLRIAVESVRDDDGRGVSASRSASQRTVPTASLPLPPLLLPYPASGRSRQMLGRFLLSGARAARIVRSFGHRPFGDCTRWSKRGRVAREDRVDASINVYASCRSITFVIGTLWSSASYRAARRVRMHFDLNREDANAKHCEFF